MYQKTKFVRGGVMKLFCKLSAVPGLFFVCLVMLLSSGGIVSADDNAYYARCNLKVLKNDSITWVNWQSTPGLVPVDTKLKVTRSGANATFIREDNGQKYEVDLGADGEAYLQKFVSQKPVNVSRFAQDVQKNIKNAVAKVGMTKEQVYIAMGPPARVTAGGASAQRMSYEDIMGADLWVYARKRFGKNIGVAFDSQTGLVSRTEGIWGKD